MAIETQSPNPSRAYVNEMNSLLRQDLSKGLRERANSQKLREEAASVDRKGYKERVDGVLSELERNNTTYNLVLQGRMNRQEQRKKLFVDEDRLKSSKINQFIAQREDKDVFNHGNDLYQQYQRQEQQHSL
jgi:hypothetical protein